MTASGERFLGRFALERKLGEGGFAEVWRVRDDAGATFALKLQRLDVRADAASRAFAREGARATALHHPHLVRVFEAGVEDGRGYLVMELVDGVTLSEELDARRTGGRGVTVGEVRRWTRQLSQAIDALHAVSLIHRDLKPANVMVHGPAKDVKLLDLGLAHDAEVAVEELTTLGRVKGTTMYMSPEQALGERVGPASDVFALTTIVFELLTGLRPWLHNEHGGMLLVGQRVPARPNDRVEVLRRISTGRRPLPSVLAGGLPRVLDHVFAAGWQRDPALRPVPTSAWAERLDAAFASMAPERSAWLRPPRDERSSLAGARAPGVVVESGHTPVAETRAAPELGTGADAHVAPPAETRPHERHRWGILGAATLALLLAVSAAALALRGRTARDSEADAPQSIGAQAVAAHTSTAAAHGDGVEAVAARASTATTAHRSSVAPALDTTTAQSPTVAPALDTTPAPSPTPPGDSAGARTHTPPSHTAPRASTSPRPRPADRNGPRPSRKIDVTLAVGTLRARLDAGAPIEEIARAVRARAASLDPERRRAVERWAESAIELADPRPLYLALDALAAP